MAARGPRCLRGVRAHVGQTLSGRGDEPAGRRQRALHVLHLPQRAVEDAALDKRDRATSRRIPTPREDARLPAERTRRAHPALQPCGERADQVAQDRRLAENRGGAEAPHVGSGLTRLDEYSAHGWIPAMDFPCAVRTQWSPVADRLRRFGRAEGGRRRCDHEMGPDLRTKRP